MLKDDVHQTDQLADELIARIEHLLENTEPSPDRENLEKRLEDMKTRWNAVKSKTSERQAEIDRHAPVLHEYHEDVGDFSVWLSDLDKKLSSQEPIGCNVDSICKQQDQANSLFAELEKHKPEYEKVQELADAISSNKPGDVYVVEAQFQYLHKVWDSVNLRLNNREKKLDSAKNAAEAYHVAMRPVKELFAHAEEGLTPLELIGPDLEKAKKELDTTKVMLFTNGFGYRNEFSTFMFIGFLLLFKLLDNILNATAGFQLTF